MAKITFYPIDKTTPIQVTREQYTNVGSGVNIVGDYTRGILGGTDFEIWDSATLGTQLTEGVDYDLSNLNAYYTAKSPSGDVYEGYQITNATYQTGDIFITYKTIGSFTSSQFYNDITTMFIGIIYPYAGAGAVPSGFLACDGVAVSRTTYAALFDRISTTWGIGDGSTTFNVPDLRGMFLRGTGSHGTLNMVDGNDYAGPAVGSSELDQMFGHKHNLFADLNVAAKGAGAGGIQYNGAGGDGSSGPIDDGVNGTPNTGPETNPVDFGINYIIKT